MTIGYMIFGMPGNLEEFADKAKRKGITQVQVDEQFEIENEETDFQTGRFLTADYVHYVIVQAEGIKWFLCNDYRTSIFSSGNRIPEIKNMVKNERRRNCVEVAERLRGLSLDAKLTSYSLWDEIEPWNFDPLYSIEQVKEWMKNQGTLVERPIEDARKSEPRTYTPLSEQTINRIKIGAGIAVAVALAAGLYVGNKSFDPDKVERIDSSGLIVLAPRFGYLQDVIRADVTGDGQKDTVQIYGKGYVFYSQDNERTHTGTRYHRLHAGTPEAQRLLSTHPIGLKDSQGF